METNNHRELVLPAETILNSSGLSFRVEEILGSGGFCITYKVPANVVHKNILIHTFFAVKELYCLIDLKGVGFEN